MMGRNVLEDSEVYGPVVQAGAVHGGIHLHTASTQRAVPHQLPPAAALFTDRSAERAWFARNASPSGAPALLVLHGEGGVGKSAVATAMLRERIGEFPDGQLYVDLGGSAPAPTRRSTGQVAAELLRALGVAPDRVPAGPGERLVLLRTLTHGRRICMLLDDAEDPGQVRALMLASPGCLTLVTARPALPELVLDGARLRQLRPWPPHTGRVLLRRVLGAKRVADEPEAALRLSELCGGLPLAIGLSAARLMADPHASISTAAADLTDCAPPRREPTTDQNPEIAMALAITYRALTEPQARLLRALAACPINIVDAPTAAAVLPCDLQQAERLLTDLVTLCLLDRPADHYVLRPLVRAYAQRRDLQLDAREPDQVRDRLTDYLVATATAAQALLTPSHHLFPYTTRFDPPPPAFTDNDGARDWISAHHHDLMGLLRHRVRERDHDAVWRLAWALWPAFHLLHLDGRLEAQRSALAAAQAAAERAAEANLLTSLAGTLMHAGELSDGAEHNRRALALHQQLGNLRGQGQAANGLAKTLLESGDLDGADAYFGRALDLRTETGYQRGVCLSRHGQGRVALARGDLRRAIELFDDAYRGLTAEGDQYDAAWSLACGAQARAGLGENDLALRHLAAALDQMRAAGSRHGQIGVLEITARVHQARGDTDGARTSFHAALDLAGYDHAARRRLQEALDALQ